MQLKLTYQGRLWGTTQSNTRAAHKHDIRKVFHPQLRRFWQTHAQLSIARYSSIGVVLGAGGGDYLWQYLASQYARVGYSFVPLAREESSLLCSIKILMLRPDAPGSLITSGDIDNRLKTLFDALRMPTQQSEVPVLPGDDESAVGG